LQIGVRRGTLEYSLENKVSGHSLLRNETLHGPSIVFILLVDSCMESFGIPIKDSISIMSRMVCTDNIPSK
jgi:hypothetical protein